MKKVFTALLPIQAIMLCASLYAAAQESPAGKSAQYVPVSKALYDTIAHMDSILFNAANAQDLKTMRSLFTEDLEFYHDASGLAGYEKTMRNFQNLFTNYKDTRRVLVAGSMEVYPIKDYGALQTGLHQFCRLENGVLKDCGTFKFLHIWKTTATGWKISRVVSYNH
jgi:ketosteroid isomerase-like protein